MNLILVAQDSGVFFNEDFWRSIVSTILGASASLAIAYGVYWCSQSKERTAKGNRRAAVADALAQTLATNMAVLKEFKQPDSQTVVYLWGETATLEGTSALRYEVLDDFDLSRVLDRILYMLTTFNRYQDLYIGVIDRPGGNNPETPEGQRSIRYLEEMGGDGSQHRPQNFQVD